MKYRLTVKGQVALATFLILLSFVATPFLLPSNQPASSANGEPAVENVQPAAPEATNSVQEPKESSQNNLTAAEEEKTSAIVYFNPNQWEIQAKEINKVTEITKILLTNPKLKIVVEGNINNIKGSQDSEFGKDLSRKRAEVVAQVLVGKGVEESRITIKSNGSSNPATTDLEKTWMNMRAHVYLEGFDGETP